MFKFSLSHSILLKLINFYPVSSYLRIEPFRRDIQVDYEGGGGDFPIPSFCYSRTIYPLSQWVLKLD